MLLILPKLNEGMELLYCSRKNPSFARRRVRLPTASRDRRSRRVDSALPGKRRISAGAVLWSFASVAWAEPAFMELIGDRSSAYPEHHASDQSPGFKKTQN